MATVVQTCLQCRAYDSPEYDSIKVELINVLKNCVTSCWMPMTCARWPPENSFSTVTGNKGRPPGKRARSGNFDWTLHRIFGIYTGTTRFRRKTRPELATLINHPLRRRFLQKCVICRWINHYSSLFLSVESSLAIYFL